MTFAAVRRAVVRCLAILPFIFLLGGQAAPTRYAEGQIWEYRTRPGDAGSLLRIQSIEDDPAFAKVGPVYHISVVGFHFANLRMQPVLPHLPVSRETLDRSVLRLRRDGPAFPDAGEAIAEWRAAHGGVFTISVAEIVARVDAQTAHVGEDVPAASPPG